MTISARPSPARFPDRNAERALERLSTALEREGVAGWDPYDALSSPAIAALARTRLTRRIAIQTLKRLPVDPRRFLGVPKQQHTKALALLVSAYARLARARGDGGYRERALQLAAVLAARALDTESGLGWGYDFDVQTRWGFYRRGQPNAIATSFAAHAFLDLAAVDDDASHTALVRRTLDFALSTLLVEYENERFFGYYGGSRTVVHNANLLISSLFSRCEKPGSPSWVLAADAMHYSLIRQKPDGSWPYGEGSGLGWVDGFHTAYVLDALACWQDATGDAHLESSLTSGLLFLRTRLIDPDGAPRATPERRHPVDIHACSSLIRTLSTLSRYDEQAEEAARRVLEWTLRRMCRKDGRFAFQLHRAYRNSVPYVRWSDAHMMLALACYVTRDDGRV